MLLQNLALKKGREAAGHNIEILTKRGTNLGQNNDIWRSYTSNQSAASRVKRELAKETCEKLSTQHQAKKKAKAVDRDFFLSVLGSSATKREARSYIQNFKPPTSAPPKPKVQEPTQQEAAENGANLGSIYTATRAVAESPKFVQQPVLSTSTSVRSPLHVALVKIRAPQLLDDQTLNGIGKTLSQLSRLGLVSTVVVDWDDGSDTPLKISTCEWRNRVKEQAARVVAAIDASGTEARLVDNVIGVAENGSDFKKKQPYLKGRVHVTLRELLMTPLRRGVLPIIPSIGHTDTTQTAVPTIASDVVLALTQEFAGFWAPQSPDQHPIVVKERLQALQNEVSLDRLILIDPLGGIPASDRKNGYHVFLNMEQEYDLVKQDLLRTGGVFSKKFQQPTPVEASPDLSYKDELPLSNFTEHQFGKLKNSPLPLKDSLGKQDPNFKFHLENLELVRNALAILPSSSSALITTPDEAANSGKQPKFKAAGVGTRRQQNPLIHNLLTDKPAFSSSLPVGRLGPLNITKPTSPSTKLAPTTFAKHGMPVTIFPDPKTTLWQPPVAGISQIRLTDPQIDLPRLVHLIEDSFNKKLDVQDYLKRVNNRVAGVIIAGEYEGGALLTWELPPGVPDDGSEESRKRMVPYLDKFAVLKKSQGSGGVADVVFKSMVRDCFPGGVCWRSRKDNPVNKWYFERSRATLKLSDTNWTMFFTTPEENMDHQTFKDYEAVCKVIKPSWADKKGIQD
ncbi:Amino-acid acetyltransferase, mitochondrial [Ciborinia camelliae]|nr:Amino-acid acetyltransferase, mitochondrial [Ciborinia camelliae]